MDSNFFPKHTIEDQWKANRLNHSHIGFDVMFSFIDPEFKIHTTVIGELRSIYHTADSATLYLAPSNTMNYNLKEFEELPLDTDIFFVKLPAEDAA